MPNPVKGLSLDDIGSFEVGNRGMEERAVEMGSSNTKISQKVLLDDLVSQKTWFQAQNLIL